MYYLPAFAYMALILLTSFSSPHRLRIARDKDGSKMLIGAVHKNDLMTDKAFPWFREGYDAYRPDAPSVRTISAHAPSLRIEVWGGTWCSDTQGLLPEFYKAMDAAGIADSQITLHLVGRDKKTKDGSAVRYQITNVPTFIVFRGDKELGRVIESARVSIEADIAALLTDKK